jgi:hypothetical protein
VRAELHGWFRSQMEAARPVHTEEPASA